MLKDEPALAAWEIINEPEGSFLIAKDDNPCFDTLSILSGSGAGWTGGRWPIKDVLRFINRQAAVIKANDPKALVTVGSWSQYASTDASGRSLGDNGRKFRLYYKDECLTAAGGEPEGVLDFFQIHTYANHGVFAPSSPFGDGLKAGAGTYKLKKPVVIGEFSAKKVRLEIQS